MISCLYAPVSLFLYIQMNTKFILTTNPSLPHTCTPHTHTNPTLPTWNNTKNRKEKGGGWGEPTTTLHKQKKAISKLQIKKAFLKEYCCCLNLVIDHGIWLAEGKITEGEHFCLLRSPNYSYARFCSLVPKHQCSFLGSTRRRLLI